MKVFAMPRVGAAERTSLRARVADFARNAVSRLAQVNARIDEERASRDRLNQEHETVDGAFWVFLR